jgi:hypothetical protein
LHAGAARFFPAAERSRAGTERLAARAERAHAEAERLNRSRSQESRFFTPFHQQNPERKEPMPDYIPSPDDGFDQWAQALVTYLTTDATAPSLTAAQKTTLTNAVTPWTAAYAAHLKAQQAAVTAAQAKDAARSTFEGILRQFIGDIQRAPATTDTQRTAMQVTVPKQGRTPVGEIESHPVMQRIDTSTRLRHRLFFIDSDTPDSTAKPAGAKFCEIREQLGGTAPTNPDTMPQLAMESRSPHRNDFQPGDEGRFAYYAMRWLNTTGDPGPWSPLYSAVVPG